MSPLGDLPRERRRGDYARAVRHSVVFGVYGPSGLIGLARAVSDLATYGNLTDVVMAPAHQGRGLGDGESLYLGAGFRVGAGALVYMERTG